MASSSKRARRIAIKAYAELYLVRAVDGSRDERQAIVLTLTAPNEGHGRRVLGFRLDDRAPHLGKRGPPEETPDGKPDAGR